MNNLWNNVKSNTNQMYNYAANAGDWLKGAFNTVKNFNNAPVDPRLGPSAGTGTTQPVVQTPASAPVIPGIPTAQAQTVAPSTGQGSWSNGMVDPKTNIMGTGQFVQGAPPQSYVDAIASAHAALPSSATGNSTFNVNTGSTVPSNYANSNTTIQDALNLQRQQQNAMINGTNPSLYPTQGNTQAMTAAQQYYTQDLPNANLFTPDQQQTYQNYVASQQALQARAYQTKKQINDLYQSGTMTKDQADQAAQDIQRENDTQMAALTLAGQGAQLDYNTMQMARSNNIAALQAEAPYYSPMQVSPGNSVVSPGSGSTMYQGSGASPATIAQQASTFIAQDEATGNLNINPDGTINQQYYQNKAQSYYQNGIGQFTSQSSQQSPTQTGQQGGQQTGVAALPPNIANQPYVIPASQNAPAYINLGRVPAGQQQYVATTAGNAGIPVLSADDASNVQGIQYTQQALQPLEQVMNQVLAPGVLGRGVNVAKNFINNIFQNQPELVAFNQARSTAIKVIQSLAAGSGSGFRLTQPEIDTATDNMPTANDNLETAQTKLQYIKSYLANELNLKITGNANNYTPPGSQSSGGSSSSSVSVGGSNFVQNAQGQWVVSQ